MRRLLRSLPVSILSLTAGYACAGGSFSTCEDTRTCPPGGDGDGDSSTGGTGDGDGDNTGGSGDGDGDTGGTGTGGGDGDGDGDNTGGMGGDPNDPCLQCGPDEYCNAADECVQCLNDNHCGEDEAPFCDTALGACVECLESSDCDDPALPMCNGGVCEAGCTISDDCTRFEDAPACEDEAGQCVQCTVDDETACALNSCDPATNTCTTTERGTVNVCEACLADSECEPNYRCVPMEFDGAPRQGGYCLKDPNQGAAGCPTNPFSTPTPARVSLSGAPAQQYCGILEAVTTCEAVLGAGNPDVTCSDASECGAVGLDDARCETVNLTPGRCTYSCDLPQNCPAALPCGGPSDAKYCGGP